MNNPTVGELVHSIELNDILATLKRLYQGEGIYDTIEEFERGSNRREALNS